MKASSRNIFTKQALHGFTIVELIVVITILTILSTIGFLSITGFSKTARDSKRITDVNMIAGQLSLHIDTSKPIITGDTAATPNVSISGSGIVMTGYYGNLNSRLLESLSIFGNDLTTDDGFQSYKYWYYPLNGKYQVLALLEDQASLAYDISIFPYAHADDQTTWYAYIKGNFTSTGWTNSLIPDPIVWAATTPDGTGLRTIAGTDTLQNAGSSASNVPTPPLAPCTIDVSNIEQCNIL